MLLDNLSHHKDLSMKIIKNAISLNAIASLAIGHSGGINLQIDGYNTKKKAK